MISPGETTAVLVDDDELARLEQKWSLLPYAESVLAQHGIPAPLQPQYAIPNITPKLLEDVTSNEYMYAYTAVAQWKVYIGSVLAQWKVAAASKREELGDIERLICERAQKDPNVSQGKRLSRDRRQELARSHPRYCEVNHLHESASAVCQMLMARFQELESYEKLMSRNVTVYENKTGRSGRGNVAHAGSGFIPPSQARR